MIVAAAHQEPGWPGPCGSRLSHGSWLSLAALIPPLSGSFPETAPRFDALLSAYGGQIWPPSARVRDRLYRGCQYPQSGDLDREQALTGSRLGVPAGL
jgi:hypothetical protein